MGNTKASGMAIAGLLVYLWRGCPPVRPNLMDSLESLAYMVFDLWCSTYGCSISWWYKTDTYSVESVLKFWSFPGLAICSTILSLDAGRRQGAGAGGGGRGPQQGAAAPSQLSNHKGKQRMHLNPFCVSLSFSINYESCSTLLSARLCLDDFAQQWATVGAVHTFQVI